MNLVQILAGEYQSITCFGLDIPGKIPYIVSLIITIMKFGIPLLLIIYGMLDLGKAVIASKEDEIKKGQQMFIKRLIAAAIVFFIVAVVQLVVGLIADDSKTAGSDNTVSGCIDNFVNYQKNHRANGTVEE